MNNDERLVSVVIPTHNRADLLPRAINSVLQQTYTNVEVIVVSDGSTDDTKSVVENIMSMDARVKFIEYKQSKGGNVARNTGIQAARGQYVAFLDDDDEWYVDKVKLQLSVFDQDSTVGLVYTGVNILYVNESIQYKFQPTMSGEISRKILLDNYIGTTSTVMVKRSIFEKAGMFDEKLAALQDFELWIRICQFTNVGVVTQPMVNYYNYTGKKQISALTQKYIDAFFYINNKHANLIKELTKGEHREKNINEWFLLGNKAMRNGEPKVARSYMLKILKTGFNKKAIIYYILSFTDYINVLRLRSIL